MTPADRPLVSIVTPVLNRVRSIETCLASVAAQTYPNVEHVVVDGGSTDGTVDVIAGFRAPHELRWISEPDGGMYEAINKGMRMARGDVLAYVNSDDFYLPWTLDVAVTALRRGADLVYGDLGVLEHEQNVGSSFHVQFYPPFDLRHYVHVQSLGQPTVFWTRAVADRVGEFDTSYALIADCEYWLRVAVAGARLDHVDEVLAIQVEHPGTLRAKRPEQLEREFVRLRTRYSGSAAPPRWPMLEERKKGLRWRGRQLRLMAQVHRQRPSEWPRFIDFLKSNHLNVTRPSRMAAAMLPARLRPQWGDEDTAAFEDRLMGVIGAAAAR